MISLFSRRASIVRLVLFVFWIFLAAAGSASAADEPAVKEEPAVKAEPAVKEEPAVKPEPAVKEEPAVNEAPVVKEEPAAKEEPAVKAEPAVKKDEPAVQAAPASFRTEGKFKIGAFLASGFGFDRIDVGKTTGGDDVTISGGGGFGAGVFAGYGLSSCIDLEVALAIQQQNETPEVKNADATFSRSMLLATVKYGVPLNERMRLNFGGGAGVYFGGELDVDTTKVAGGSRQIIEYGTAVGPHLVGEFEGTVSEGLTLVAGLRLYRVIYPAESYSLNGVKGPASAITNSEVRNLDGSGLDVYVAIAKYF